METKIELIRKRILNRLEELKFYLKDISGEITLDTNSNLNPHDWDKLLESIKGYTIDENKIYLNNKLTVFLLN